MVRKRALAPVLCACLSTLGMASVAHAQQILVGYDHKVSSHALKAQASALGASRSVGRIAGGTVGIFRVANSSAKATMNTLRQQPGVRYVEPDYPIKPFSAPNDTLWGDLWGMSNIGLPDAWTMSTGADGTGITVAVTDSGIQLDHPDLVNQLWTNPGETADNSADDDGNGLADDMHGADYCMLDGEPNDAGGHGTHVSGTIAAEKNNNEGVAGVAPGAKIMALRFIGNGGSLYCNNTSGAIYALEYAIAKGAKVINASWGGPTNSKALSDELTKVKNAGILFVAAAGNDGKDIDKSPTYPASYTQDNIITVDALDSSNAMASFSNWGAKATDIGAPGVSITSTWNDGSYNTIQGTSMATPHVAGAAAALWSKEPTATYAQIKAAIIAGGTTTPAMSGKSTTGKRLNLAGAFTQLDIAMNGPQSVTVPEVKLVSGKLTCGTGTWSPASPKYLTYTWLKNEQVVPGANKNAYTVPSGDMSASFVCEVGASNMKDGTAVRVADSKAIVPNTPPPLAGAVTISGFNGMDGALTCNKGTWMYGTITYEYQWYRDGVEIADATSPTYTIGSSDRSHSLTCKVTGTNDIDAVSATSSALAVKWADDAITPAAPQAGTIPAVNNKTSFAVVLKGEKGARFYCKVDDGDYTLCTTPVTVSGLVEGNHLLSVKQKDQAGNLSPAVTQEWTTDLTAPSAPTAGYNFDTTAASAVDGSIPSTTTNLAVAFFPSGEGGGSFQCSLNSTRLSNCSTKQVFSKLRKGLQTFRLQQTDAAGNASATTTITWTIT